MMCHSCDAPAKYYVKADSGIPRLYCLRHAKLNLNNYLRPTGDEQALQERIAALRVERRGAVKSVENAVDDNGLVCVFEFGG